MHLVPGGDQPVDHVVAVAAVVGRQPELVVTGVAAVPEQPGDIQPDPGPAIGRWQRRLIVPGQSDGDIGGYQDLAAGETPPGTRQKGRRG